MKRLSMHLVSLLLLVGLTAFCGSVGLHLQPLNASQHATFHTNAQLMNTSVDSPAILADGTDPVPPPMPLPGSPKPPAKPPSRANQTTYVLTADGTDPVPPPMPLPGAPKPAKPPTRANQSTYFLTADGTDPVPPPMPLPGAPKPVKPPSLTA